MLGTDGFGRSDSRKNLRRFFEVNRFYVTVAALKALADEGEIPATKVAEAIKKYGIEPERPAPWTSERRQPRDNARNDYDHPHEERRLGATEVTVPDIGDFKDIPVIEVLVKPGDTVKKDDSLHDARERQGDDGGAVADGGRGGRAEGQDRRQGQRRYAPHPARGRGADGR